MGRLFGTDGVRGIAGSELTSELALSIGKALGYVLRQKKDNNRVLIGSDTRISRDMLVNSVSAGLCSMGVDVINVGIIPTPGVSYIVDNYEYDAGVMITASHNPYQFNGIKIFNSKGYKLDDKLEDEIEELINNIDKLSFNGKIGKIINDSDLLYKYVDHLVGIKKEDFSKLKICVDTSNGSASISAPLLFSKLGCKYEIINKDYNGININDNCGSTHIDVLVKYVKDNNFDLGIAFDGDADRCILVDNKGNVRDGDYILAITSKYLKDKNELNKNTVVGTVMSNLGFVKYCEGNDIKGGEQSGHIIFKDYANTGDGELTAVMVLNVMASLNKSLEELSNIMKKYPQVMINVTVSNDKKDKFHTDNDIKEEIKKVEDVLKDTGRVLVRPSGTEPLIRVMLEGEDLDIINKYAKELALYIENKLK